MTKVLAFIVCCIILLIVELLFTGFVGLIASKGDDNGFTKDAWIFSCSFNSVLLLYLIFQAVSMFE